MTTAIRLRQQGGHIFIISSEDCFLFNFFRLFSNWYPQLLSGATNFKFLTIDGTITLTEIEVINGTSSIRYESR